MQPTLRPSTALAALASALALGVGPRASGQGLTDTIMCRGQILVLEAAPGYEDYRWTPREGIVSSVGPRVAFDVERETTFALAAERRIGPDLIDDGDFDGGGGPFANQLTEAPGGQLPAGSYAVVARAGQLAGDHADCPAQGATADDRMLAVHLAAGAGARVWCRDIRVAPRERYRVDYQVGNLLAERSRPIRVTVDGEAVGPLRAAEPVNCVWRGYGGAWSSGGAVSAEVCIEVTPGPQPTKLAFDRISVFRLDEVYRDTVTITPVPAPEPIDVVEEVCRGSRYRGRGLDLAPGQRGVARFTAPGGCDSVVTVDVVAVDSVVRRRRVAGLCGGDAYVYPATGARFTRDTVFDVTFTNAAGCDSTERITLEFFDAGDVGVRVDDPACGGSAGSATVAVAEPFASEASVEWADGVRGPSRARLPADSETGFSVTTPAGCRLDGLAVVGSSERYRMGPLDLRETVCPEPPSGRIALTGSKAAAIVSVVGAVDGVDYGPEGLPGGRYEVVAEDYRGCGDTVVVDLPAPPALAVDLSGDTEVGYGAPARHAVAIAGPVDVDAVEWKYGGEAISGGDGPAIVWFPTRSDSLSVVVSDERGCAYTRSLDVRRQGRGAAFLPSAFSPDGNDLNEVFGPVEHPGIERLLEMTIADRWGGLVYAGDAPWDGVGCVGGTYTYRARLALRDGQVVERRGTVTLAR